MTSEERDILHFLRGASRAFFTPREISKRAASRKTFEESPDWARPHLPGMVARGLLEVDESGRYRIKNYVDSVQANGRKWISPHVAKLLKESGKDFSQQATTELDNEDY